MAGGAGAIVMGVVLLAGWSILGEALSAPQITVNQFGIEETVTNLHPLFSVLVVAGIFLSSLVAHTIHGILLTLNDENTKPRRTLLTQIFFSQVVLLVLTIPLYFAASSGAGATVSGAVALLHILLGLVLAHAIVAPPSLIRTFGLTVGVALFGLALILVTHVNVTLAALLALPLGLGLRELGDAMASMWYTSATRAYGIEILEDAPDYDEDETNE